MLNYIEEKDDKLCCGCRACEQICPKQAIKFVRNIEGFLYPELDDDKCIHCNLCEKVCPIMNRPNGNKVSDVYAVQHKDSKELKESSSGGVFRLLADEIIERNGYVVGCVWNREYQPVLEITNSKEQLLLMQGSKYLSSDTRDVYVKIKELLEDNKTVLFTGTPCQCAGLINFLPKKYENLITADFLCHGVPSQKAFDAYMEELSRRNKNDNWKENMIQFKFRDKNKLGWGKVSSYTWKKGNKVCKKYYIGLLDSYNYAFTNSYLKRYSCYNCSFRGEDRFTDVTFSDFWGCDNYYINLDISKGVSALSVNTDKGREFLKDLEDKAQIFRTSPELVAVENPTLLKNPKEMIPQIRMNIYEKIDIIGWRKVSRKYFRCKNWMLRKIWYMLPIPVMRMIKGIAKNKNRI